MRRSLLFYLLIIFILIILLTSCFNNENGEADSLDNEYIFENPHEYTTLRILAPTLGYEGMIRDVMSAKFPEQAYEFVYLPSDLENWRSGYEHYLEHENIDLVYTDQFYKVLAENGFLYPLDHFMREPDFLGHELHPSALRQYQIDGEVYGLSPYYHTNVIYYNNDLFDEYGVTYPTDKMTWEELFELAAQFTDREEEVKGMLVLSPSIFLHHIAVTRNLRYFEETASGLQFQIENDSWKEAWEFVQQGFEGEYVDLLFGITGLNTSFLEGKAAIAFGDTVMIDRLVEHAEFAWDIVTEPVHPANRNESISLSFASPLAISSQSNNIELAWQVLKYIHSSEYAAELAKEGKLRLFMRTSYIDTDQDYNISAFFSLSSGNRHYDDVFEGLPAQFDIELFTFLLREELAQVIEGRTSVEEALESLQGSGEEILVEALNKNRGER